jgi:O-antigen/teichoic acid export membrane protein
VNSRLKLDFARIRRLSKESFWIFSGQVAAVMGALVGVRVLTDLMSPSEYGQVALGMTVATFLGQAWLGPLSTGAARFFSPASEAGEVKSYLNAVGQLMSVVTKTMLPLILVISIFVLMSNFKAWLLLIVAALIFATVTSCNGVANGIQNAARQRVIVALHTGAVPWIRLFLAVSLIYFFGVSSTAVLCGYAIAAIVILISQYHFFKRILKMARQQRTTLVETSHIWKSRIIDYSWPFATWGVFFALYQASDRWALLAFSSASDVGLFSVLYQLGYYPVAIITEMLFSLLTPIIFSRAGDGKDLQRLNNAMSLNLKIFGAVLLTTVCIFFVTWITHELIFKFFVAKEYREVSYLLPWISLSAGLVTSGHILSLARMSAMETKALIAPKVLTAILGGVLNVLGAFLYGLEGIVIAQILFSIIYLGWMAFQFFSYGYKLKLTLS